MTTPKTAKQKPPRWAEMADGMKQEILKKLAEGGFASEIQARRIFTEEGFGARATYFHDKDSNQTRELDILAYLNPRGGCNFYHGIVAEVKSGYIWILSNESPSDDFEHVIDHSIHKWFGKGLSNNLFDPDWNALAEHVGGSSIAAPTIATSIHQHRGNERDVDRWYEAASKVLKAAVDLEGPTRHEGKKTSPMPDLFVVIPLVILDGNLLAASCDPSGVLSLEPREHAEVRFSYASSNYDKMDTSIHIVTLDCLAKFLRRVREAENTASVLTSKLYAQESPREGPSETSPGSVDERHPPPE